MPYQYGNGCPKGTGRNDGIYPKTIYGSSIHDNPVPVWTAEKNHHPFVAFQDPGTGKKIGLNKELLSYGFLIQAEPGGGKTNVLHMIMTMLIATMKPGDKIIVFDSKGDYLQEFGDRIPRNIRTVIGAGAEYRDITAYHNIFAEIMPRGRDGRLVYTPDCDIDALEKAKQQLSGLPSETQPIFPKMAEKIVAGVLVYFMRTYWRTDQKMLNNKAFIDFLNSGSNETLKQIFQLDYMKDYRSCIDSISGKSAQTQGVNSYVGTTLQEMFIGPFAMSDPTREFSMREIIDSPNNQVVFVEYDLRRGETLAPMYGLLMDSALANGLGGRHSDRSNVYLIMDEMLLIPPLMHLSNGLNFGRSQGIKLLCGLQNVSGLEERYGETGARSVLASFQNIIAFHTCDYETRRFLIDRLGTNYQNISFSAQQENLNIQREGHTVEDWDILSLGLGDAIISLKGEKPFFFTMPRYR